MFQFYSYCAAYGEVSALDERGLQLEIAEEDTVGTDVDAFAVVFGYESQLAID